MTSTERDSYARQIKIAKDALKVEQDRVYAAAANKANQVWSNSNLANEVHPYLKTKGVQPHGVKISQGNIVVPVMDNDGNISSLQFIDLEGNKKFLKGGKVKGGTFPIGEQSQDIYIAEGFATAATINEIMGDKVYCTFNAGNLLDVAKQIREDRPESHIVVCADNDCWKNQAENPGLDAAKKVEALVDNVSTRVPVFANPESQPTDFNDLFLLEGADVVRQQLVGITLDDAAQMHTDSVSNIDFPAHCLENNGIFGEICGWIDQTALIEQRILTVASLLPTLGAIFGRSYSVRSTNTRTNLLTVGLLATGGGKDHQRKCCKKMLQSANLGHLVSGGSYTSGSAIISALQRYPAAIGFVDEFGLYLNAITGKNSSTHQQSVLKTIMELYSSSNGTYQGTEYSTLTLKKSAKPDRVDIDRPSLNIYGTSTPETFYGALNSGDVVSGYLNRWLIFEGDSKATLSAVDFERSVDDSPPASVIDWLTEAGEFLSDPDEEKSPTQLVDVLVSKEAAIILNQVREKQEQERLNGSSQLKDLWVRYLENAIKVSAIRAICDNLAEPVIEKHHAEWARDVVGWCITNTVSMIRSRVADSAREQAAKDMWRFIDDAGSAGTTRTLLTRKFQRLDKRQRDGILADLVETEAVVETRMKTEGAVRDTIIYVSSGPPS